MLVALLASPTIASKEWAYRQYDQQVGINTLVLPGSDAAVLRVKGTRRAVAVATDGNGRHVYLDPRSGAAMAVAEAARNVACAGGRPIGVTDCLNFGSPERPEILWQFREAVRGLSEACRALSIPVVSGNVSFYNETEGRAIHPTPAVAVVGLLPDPARTAGPWFREPGDSVLLLGRNREELGGSEYLAAALLDLAWHELGPDDVVDDVAAFESAALAAVGLLVARRQPRNAIGWIFLVSAAMLVSMAACAEADVVAALEVARPARRLLGEVEEYFIETLTPGDTFVFAGEILKYETLVEDEVYVSRSTAADPKVPAYEGGKFPLSTYLAARVRDLLADHHAWRALPAQVREWLEIQEWRSLLPPAGDLLVETFPRATKHHLVCYPFEGRLAHQTLGMLLTRRLERARLRPLGFVANEYALAVWTLGDVGRAIEDGRLSLAALFDESWRVADRRRGDGVGGAAHRRHPALGGGRSRRGARLRR